MKLYVNGDSHAAGAEAVNSFAFANDDPKYFYLGRAPHPDNASVAWPGRLAQAIKAVLHNDSESASSNQRILRTTNAWLEQNKRWWPEIIVIIGWSTWDREEWLIDNVYYQVNASGIDHVPESHQDQYRKFIADVDWHERTEFWHENIWNMHLDLSSKGIRHVFFNCNSHFGSIPENRWHDWGHSFIHPYRPDMIYDAWLKTHNHHTVTPKSWHFDSKAHAAWARFVLQYLNQYHFLELT